MPALLQTGRAGADRGLGVIAAKATFRFDARGGVTLDSQDPFDLFAAPQGHPLGFLPADRVTRRGTRFEVMLLGCAYAQRPVTSLRVALSIGDVRREMEVFGDRSWLGLDGGSPTIGPAQPFERMPLTYDRAFGGTFPVQLDADTVLDVFDPINRRGRGFDARLWADSLAKSLGTPPGYPILKDYTRPLPNLEDPRARIQRPDDAPEPVGWAPADPDIAVNHLAQIRREAARVAAAQGAGRPPVDVLAAGAPSGDAASVDPDESFYQAHSDWVISTPSAGAMIRLENLLPDAPVLQLGLPRLRLIADYVIYGRVGERELRPFAIVILPDERAFYLVYTSTFTFEPGPASERAFRLRTATGWFSA